MPEWTAIAYLYDGSYAGFLCCVFECFSRRETPQQVFQEQEAPVTMLSVHRIETDESHAIRVQGWVEHKLPPLVRGLFEYGWLSAQRQEADLLYLLCRARREGEKVVSDWGDPVIARLLKTQKNVGNEAHYFREFLRFSEREFQGSRALVSVIHPKNQVLSLVQEHYCTRYPNESFLIHDATHSQALIYQPRQAAIVDAQDILLGQIDETEIQYRQLWRRYYDAIAVEGRINPRCRMSHMPKRYWQDMTEFQTEEDERQLQNRMRRLEKAMNGGAPQLDSPDHPV